MSHASDIARLIQLNGGHLVGKTRLQKSAYFLEMKGAGFGFDFSYYHFGPYSEELSNATDDALALSMIDVNWKTSQAGTEYAEFLSSSSESVDSDLDIRRRRILDVLRNYTAIEVELAATADFLNRNGYANDPWAETRRRKAAKMTDLRMAKSQQLLVELSAT
jgi:uncharacterized protein YwgA